MDPEPDFPAHWDVLHGEPPMMFSSNLIRWSVRAQTAAVMRDMRKCPHCGAILRRPATGQ